MPQKRQLFCRERNRLARAGTAWLPTKARAFDPDERILSKLACAEGWRQWRAEGGWGGGAKGALAPGIQLRGGILSNGKI